MSHPFLDRPPDLHTSQYLVFPRWCRQRKLLLANCLRSSLPSQEKVKAMNGKNNEEQMGKFRRPPNLCLQLMQPSQNILKTRLFPICFKTTTINCEYMTNPDKFRQSGENLRLSSPNNSFLLSAAVGPGPATRERVNWLK